MTFADSTTHTEQAREQAWIARAVQGDNRAFGELVSLHRAGVVGVVYRMCGDMPLAEEAAQEAFLRAWQHLNKYQSQHSFRAWVYRIAINAALDVLRRERKMTGLTEIGGERLPQSGPGLQERSETREQAERVQQAILALPDGARAVLVLREYGAMSYAEIAAALNIPAGTVMSRLNSARAQLRQALLHLLAEPEPEVDR
jgi:RNA polymerase sigma-70 factor, ECF subfamily